MSRFRKMARPAPNRASSLWRWRLFAFCAGWEKGYRQDGTNDDAAVEDQFQARGRWIGSLDETNYIVLDMGRAMDEGLSDDRIGWSDLNNRYDNPNGFMSAAVLVRPDIIQNGEQAIGMAAFWNRPLSGSEIALLNSDPYIM